MKSVGAIGLAILASMLVEGTAWAGNVDISQMDKVEVGSWGELKAAVEDSANAGKVIVLTKDIQADADNPIDTVGGSGIIIDGGGFTITGQEGSSNGQFIQFDSSDKTDLIIQNIKLNQIRGKQSTYNTFTGLVYNAGNINAISGIFSNNHATGSFYGEGGILYNEYGSIRDITGTFINNYAQGTYSAQGGAIYNGYDTIGNITGDFSNNYAQGSDSAQGGAIYNGYGTMTLVNSSFYDNYVQTGAEKNSTNGQKTLGGAIYSNGDLTIKADNGKSIFRGNKVIWADGEDSSAIYFYQNLRLDSVNNGLIQFDDKISGEGITFSQTMSKDELEAMLAGIPPEAEITQDGDDYFVSNPIYGEFYQFIKQADGTYTMTVFSGAMTITGDSSSRVVFNNAVENAVWIAGTNVDVNKGVGTISKTVTHDGGVLNINANAKAEDSVINDKGTMNVADTAEISRTEVNDGGTLHIASGGYAQDTTVNSGGTLVTENQAKLHNMLANAGANLDIDVGSYLTGNIIIDANAIMGGTYDYSKIFKDEVTDKGSLTLVGGLNNVLNESSLINTTEGKNLHLTAGDYVIGNGAQAVNGWDMLTFKDNANVKLEGDIALSDASKKLIIENGSTLDLAGHSPSNYTITGSVNNDGSMTFTHAGDEADDITTIYGNYTAYNNAQMTIDVSPSTNTADLLRIDGDVSGTTNVVLNVLEYDVKPTQLIQFVEAVNDDLSTGAYFNIYRVNGSAFNWNSLHLDDGWYTATDDIIPDDTQEGYGTSDTGSLDDADLNAPTVLPPNFPTAPTTPGGSGNGTSTSPSVVGEAIAYMGLPSAGIEQTRDLTRIVSDKVASSKIYNGKCCGFYDAYYNAKPLHNAWVSPVYAYSKVKAPFSYDAKISGLDAGFDIQSDVFNRLGVFASYRHGQYDFDGKGDDYYSKTSSDIDIDSYVLGLYHRYDHGQIWAMSQIFAGYQDVDFSSDDGVSSSTDGFEFGASVEAGVVFTPAKHLTLEPIARVSYVQINYDDASDAYGKNATYGDVRNIEFEAGVKPEKTYLNKYDYAKLYIKPSIIQTISSGDVHVTSLRQVDGLKNATLGRIEIGGSMNFDTNWSGYANAFYTFGTDYTNLGANAGVNYAF